MEKNGGEECEQLSRPSRWSLSTRQEECGEQPPHPQRLITIATDRRDRARQSSTTDIQRPTPMAKARRRRFFLSLPFIISMTIDDTLSHDDG